MKLLDHHVYQFRETRQEGRTAAFLAYTNLIGFRPNCGLLRAAFAPDGPVLYLVVDGAITTRQGWPVGAVADLWQPYTVAVVPPLVDFRDPAVRALPRGQSAPAEPHCTCLA